MDESKSYVLLISVQGEYTLEPIFDNDDPWLATVRTFFKTRKQEVPLRATPRSFKLVRSGPCVMYHERENGLDEFKQCILDRVNKDGRRATSLDVDVDGEVFDFYVQLSEGRIPRAELLRVFGTDFGMSNGIPFDGMAGSVATE
ncbi:hypothetical protein [Tahibacter amnicola]|uniref:Uncharacterized protein n=1 Tax=Tahibacter amnicola TaxID=2976241 RepID=A0ABY6BHN2_9GAMM|nr:hypothetical protein [Tahibacter amnicola]UXI69287.1 hypothetical protein N4264_06460 [Tahibacter amnicola]